MSRGRTDRGGLWHGTRGSATVQLLAFAMVLVLLGVGVLSGLALAAAGQRARNAADLAVLAVADNMVADNLTAPDACAVGERVAAANGAQLLRCRAAQTRSRVEVLVQLPWGGRVVRVAEAVSDSRADHVPG